jgi:hypothetical protein
VNWPLVLRRAGIACLIVGAIVVGIVGILRYLPYCAGGVSSFLIFPFYNLVCTNASQTNIGSALLKLPQVGDFQTFLNNQGCSAADADARSALNKSEDGSPPAGMGPFFGPDRIGRFFNRLLGIVLRAFTDGQEDGAAWLLYTLRKSVLFEAFYYFLYTAITVCAIQLVNSATQDLYRLVKLLLLDAMESKPPTG